MKAQAKGISVMVIVEKDKCVGCGLCVKICHEHCIHLVNRNNRKEIEIDNALCSTCTQCIAICSQQALSWNGVLPMPFQKEQMPALAQLKELLKERRTTRYFKKGRIDRALLEEIIQMGIYAPTNNYNLRAIVVDDPATLQEFDAIILRYVSLVYNLFYKPQVLFKVLNAITPLVTAKQKVKLETGLRRGSAFESMPAATIFIVGDARILESETSAQYALYNMILCAQVKDIGSRISAAGVLTLDRNRAVRRYLKLQRHEHILANLDLGYPAVRFRNKVEGKRMPVIWAGEKSHGSYPAISK
jgi:formate hydrogenlyase subunit 6/NADH:ubiquinone oxidoreductase subunit I